MKHFVAGIMMCVAGVSLCAAVPEKLEAVSPDGTHRLECYTARTASGVNTLCYEVTYKGKKVIEQSRVGLELDNRVWEKALGFRKLEQPDCWMDNLEVDSVSYGKHDEVWNPLYGERSTVRDCYNAGTLYLSKKDGSKYRMNIEVRAYDEGVAFRYFFPEHPQAIFHKVTGDLTEYTLPEGTKAWAEEWAQAPFDYVDVNALKHPVERTLTLELPDGKWMALTDADVDDWCLTKFIASTKKRNTLESVMYSPVDAVTYFASPWKVIMVADKPGELLEHNDIIQNLNPPCEIADASWVKPGKIMRETTLTTKGAMETIDFCAAHKIPYMLFDWQWYMPCTSFDGDATKVVSKLNLPKVIAYGKKKGVGVWLYVNQHALQKQMRELFPLLHEWGVVGVKSGFVQYASHRWSVWLHDMVRYAAENKLMINIHDEFRPSGFSRTYPNLLTQEGIHGNEEFPDATHNTILPFTRMINGAADYTICYYDKRLKTTHAHQLAASLIFYSPLQTIFWYDKPSFYGSEPEIEWFEELQTVFDESKVIDGTPGKNVTIARRSGEEWFVGLITNNDASTQKVDLSFLEDGKTYVAHLYTDGGEETGTRTQVKCSKLLLTGKQALMFALKPSGGAAVRLVPASERDLKEYASYQGETL